MVVAFTFQLVDAALSLCLRNANADEPKEVIDVQHQVDADSAAIAVLPSGTVGLATSLASEDESAAAPAVYVESTDESADAPWLDDELLERVFG